MEQNNESNGSLTKLALICDALQNIHKAKGTIVFEVDEQEFNQLKEELKINKQDKNFKLDISGTEVIYILNQDE
jgi:hypothetical protein